jgi:hypothetical protein
MARPEVRGQPTGRWAKGEEKVHNPGLRQFILLECGPAPDSVPVHLLDSFQYVRGARAVVPPCQRRVSTSAFAQLRFPPSREQASGESVLIRVHLRASAVSTLSRSAPTSCCWTSVGPALGSAAGCMPGAGRSWRVRAPPFPFTREGASAGNHAEPQPALFPATLADIAAAGQPHCRPERIKQRPGPRPRLLPQHGEGSLVARSGIRGIAGPFLPSNNGPPEAVCSLNPEPEASQPVAGRHQHRLCE